MPIYKNRMRNCRIDVNRCQFNMQGSTIILMDEVDGTNGEINSYWPSARDRRCLTWDGIKACAADQPDKPGRLYDYYCGNNSRIVYGFSYEGAC